jgi:hypothetical protein
MRTSRSVVFIALAIAAAGIAGIVAPAVSQAPDERTITLFDPNRTEFERFVNVGPRAFSPGDAVLFKEVVLDPRTCDVAGRIVGRLTFHQILSEEDENALALLDGGFRLSEGRIMFYGPIRLSEFGQARPFTAITGGTRAYKDVSGQGTINEGVSRCGKNGALITLDLSLD